MSSPTDELNSLIRSEDANDVPGMKPVVSRLSRVVMFCCVAAIAIDYAVVMPSIWLFLQDLDPDVPEWVLGLAIGSFSLSSFLLQYPLGVWLDRRSMREVLVAILWISLFGNVAYFLCSQVWMVCLARFVCGAGTSVYLITSVFILRTTEEESRSEQFAWMNAVMMLAMIVGPAINFPLTLAPHTPLIFGLELNSLNIVGLVMAVVFGLLVVLVHAGFEEPPRKAAQKKLPLSLMSQVLKMDTSSLLIAQFVALFNQTCLEVIIPPVVIALFSFGQVFTSVFYAGLTLYLLVAFVVAGQLSKCLSDRVMILCGWLCVGCGGLILLLSELVTVPAIRLWQFALGGAVFATSSAFFESAVPSLFSKLCSRHMKDDATAASSQSLLVMVQSLAILVGPFVASPILNAGLVWVFIVILAVWFCSFVFFLFSFRYLVVHSIETVEEKAVN